MRTFAGYARAMILATAFSSTALAFAKAEDDAARAKLAPKLARELSTSRHLQRATHDILLRLSKSASLQRASLIQERTSRIGSVQKALANTAAESQAAVRAELERLGLDYTPYYIGNMIAVRGASEAQILALAERGDITRIASDAPVRILPESKRAWFADEDSEMRGIEAAITTTGAPRVWSEFSSKGAGIVVAGQDTGIEGQHPALKKHYRGYREGQAAVHDYNWHDAIHRPLAAAAANPCGYDTAAPCDDHGHGTHTMGTIVGDDGRGNQIGMAPEAKWIGCRNMDAGLGRPSSYLECFQYFLAPWPRGGDPVRDGKPEFAPHVINNSWGCPTSEGCDGDDFLPVLEALKAAGIMVVVSAGNDGSRCSTIQDGPAHHSDLAFRVGAHDHRSGVIASFSSRGPSAFDNKIGPDLTAPGVSIRSSVPGGRYSSAMWSGTSMAGPHVAGAVALLWSHDESYRGKIDPTIALFRGAATPKTTTQTCGGVPGSQIPNNTYGYGALDVYKAMQQSK